MVTSTQRGYRGIFANAEFRALFTAQLISVVGDQFARVALSVLVFDRTHSPAWTALTYGLTFLPDLVGGPLLSGLADRYPRRRLMVGTDLTRAGLVALMAVPGTPIWLLCLLLVAVQLISAPANAARGALVPTVLGDADYPAGQAALQTVMQFAQVIGFAGGGALTVAIGTGGVLLADAATFAASALLVWWLVVPRPAAAGDADVVQHGWWRDFVAGTALVWTDRRLRALVGFACLSGFYIVGEAIAVPYADSLDSGAVAVGFMFAGYAAGASVGMLVLARLPEPLRLRLLPPLAVGTSVPLVACFADPGLVLVVALFVATGVASAYQVTASTTFMIAVPDARRGQAFGLAVTALKVSQGIGVTLAGLAAEGMPPYAVVGSAGLLGMVAAAGVAWSWRAAGGREAVLAGSSRAS